MTQSLDSVPADRPTEKRAIQIVASTRVLCIVGVAYFLPEARPWPRPFRALQDSRQHLNETKSARGPVKHRVLSNAA